jgi:hypothetical protein
LLRDTVTPVLDADRFLEAMKSPWDEFQLITARVRDDCVKLSLHHIAVVGRNGNIVSKTEIGDLPKSGNSSASRSVGLEIVDSFGNYKFPKLITIVK